MEGAPAAEPCVPMGGAAGSRRTGRKRAQRQAQAKAASKPPRALADPAGMGRLAGALRTIQNLLP
eukprot:8369574-Alexandrium_andersonii.AAC.1